MKFLRTAFLICLTTLSINVYAARSAVPLVNYDNIAIVTGSNKAPQLDQVKQAVRVGAAVKGWTIEEAADGSLIASIVVRDKHKVSVKIDYDASKYAIHYKDSAVMKYEVNNGQAVVHPFYNVWVENLKNDINIELLKL
jgi:hypothetical protein